VTSSHSPSVSVLYKRCIVCGALLHGNRSEAKNVCCGCFHSVMF